MERISSLGGVLISCHHLIGVLIGLKDWRFFLPVLNHVPNIAKVTGVTRAVCLVRILHGLDHGPIREKHPVALQGFRVKDLIITLSLALLRRFSAVDVMVTDACGRCPCSTWRK